MSYPNLEPNHRVDTDSEGLRLVYCPFEVGPHGEVTLRSAPLTFTASWSAIARDDEIECPVCEVFKGQLRYVGPPGEHLDDDTDPEL